MARSQRVEPEASNGPTIPASKDIHAVSAHASGEASRSVRHNSAIFSIAQGYITDRELYITYLHKRAVPLILTSRSWVHLRINSEASSTAAAHPQNIGVSPSTGTVPCRCAEMKI